MSELTVFKSRAPVMGYCFKNGKLVYFVNHVYATASKEEIAELTTECENDHPNYYIDSEQTKIESELLDPMAVLRARIREEERAKLIAATDPTRDMGATAQGKLEGIANSHTINGLQAHSEAQFAAAHAAPTAPAVNKPIVLAAKTK